MSYLGAGNVVKCLGGGGGEGRMEGFGIDRAITIQSQEGGWQWLYDSTEADTRRLKGKRESEDNMEKDSREGVEQMRVGEQAGV